MSGNNKAYIDNLNTKLHHLHPKDIIRWVLTNRTDICMSTGLQFPGCTVIHMLHSLGADHVPIYFIDTGYHFKETLDTAHQIQQNYLVDLKIIHPKQTVQEQFTEHNNTHLYGSKDTYKSCCNLRKVQPWLEVAKDHSTVFNGLSKWRGSKRNNLPIVSYEPRIEALVFSPLAYWNEKQINQYIKDNKVIINPLHKQSYPSIGCKPCTTPVQSGEDIRAGRWRHLNLEHRYCGINFTDQDKPT